MRAGGRYRWYPPDSGRLRSTPLPCLTLKRTPSLPPSGRGHRHGVCCRWRRFLGQISPSCDPVASSIDHPRTQIWQPAGLAYEQAPRCLSTRDDTYFAIADTHYAGVVTHYADSITHYAGTDTDYAAADTHYAASDTHYAASDTHYAASDTHYADAGCDVQGSGCHIAKGESHFDGSITQIMASVSHYAGVNIDIRAPATQ